MIPKILHQIWVGPYKLPSREAGFVDLIKKNQTDFQHVMWTNDNVPELPSELKTIYDFFETRADYVHQADLLRVFILEKFGGVYLDVDFEYKRGLSEFNLENYDAFFCTHLGNVDTFPNGVFGMSPHHPISQHMLKDMVSGFPHRYWYGPSWIADMVKQYFNVQERMEYDNFTEKYFNPNNIFHINYDKFHWENYFHHALYAWSPENKKKFQEGKII